MNIYIHIFTTYTFIIQLYLPHTNTAISGRFSFFDDFRIVYLDLVVVSLLTNLPLYYFTIYRSHQFLSHKMLTFCFKLTVKIVKNNLCNGFK